MDDLETTRTPSQADSGTPDKEPRRPGVEEEPGAEELRKDVDTHHIDRHQESHRRHSSTRYGKAIRIAPEATRTAPAEHQRTAPAEHQPLANEREVEGVGRQVVLSL